MKLIQEHGVFTVEIHSDLEPLQYRDKNDSPAGICVDIMNQIADYLDMQIEYIYMEPDTKRKHDCADISLCVYEQNVVKEKYNSSLPYLDTEMWVIKRNNLPEKENYVMGIPDYVFLNEQQFLNQPEMRDMIIMDSQKFSYNPSIQSMNFKLLISREFSQEYVEIFNTAITSLGDQGRSLSSRKV